MFKWFKKKDKADNREHLANDAHPRMQTSSTPKITKADLQLLAQANFKANAHASMFYAQCAGMKVGTLNDQNISLFVRNLLNTEPGDLSKDNIKKAVDYWLGEFFDGLISDIWDLSLGVISTEEYSQRQFRQMGMANSTLKDPSQLEVGKNILHRDRLATIRQKALKLNVQPPYRRFFDDFDVEKTILDVCLQRRNEDYAKITTSIDEKFEILKPIYLRLRNTSQNKYGDYDAGPQLQELEEFINYRFKEDDFDFYYSIKPLAKLLDYIESNLDTDVFDDIPVDGIDFEHWCASQLRLQGWQVQVSKSSGDQGVDVIARREGCSVAIQCKRYSQPVGNKAVQEIFSAKKFASTDHACVIGTGGFTRSARELAGATGVLLLEAEAGLQEFSNSYGFDSQLPDVGEDDDVALEFTFESNNEAKKAIIKSFFSIVDSMDAQGDDTIDIPDALIDNFDPHSGEGKATLDAAELVTLLTFSDLHLSGKADLTDGVREQFRSSDTLWQQEIGEDKSIQEVSGILGYGSTTPGEIREEFCSLWNLCEMFVGFEADDPYRQALNEIHRERMEENRPKILDADF